MPKAVLSDHRFLLSYIDSLAALKDSTGITALKLKELMEHHFKEEEDYVLPELGTLRLLSHDSIPPNSGEIILLCEKFKSRYNHIIAEHQLITAFINEMLVVSKKENHPSLGAFKSAVAKHAAEEEAIYFPAAMLVGQYLKLKIK